MAKLCFANNLKNEDLEIFLEQKKEKPPTMGGFSFLMIALRGVSSDAEGLRCRLARGLSGSIPGTGCCAVLT